MTKKVIVLKNNRESIGWFKGKAITKMNKKELLEVIRFFADGVKEEAEKQMPAYCPKSSFDML